nr:transcription antitermination factor NusB [Corynebacterium ulceribovis]
MTYPDEERGQQLDPRNPDDLAAGLAAGDIVAEPVPEPERPVQRRGARYRARRRAVDILFEAEQRGANPAKIVNERMALGRDRDSGIAPVNPYTVELVEGVHLQQSGLDSTIATYLSAQWPLHRIPAVDRAILRVATWELFHNPEVPVKVAVVEAVELASEYSTDAAPPYINAVLDSESEVAEYARQAAAAVTSAVLIDDNPPSETPAEQPQDSVEELAEESADDSAE